MSTENTPPSDSNSRDTRLPGDDWLPEEVAGPPTNVTPESDDVFEVDLSEIPNGPSSFVGKVPPALDSGVALDDLPPLNPSIPASGWLDSQVGLPKPRSKANNVPPIPTSGPSDIFSAPAKPGHNESDVIGGLLGRDNPASSSSIFDAPPAGSSRFANPTEPTDEQLDDSPSGDLHEELFGKETSPPLPSSDVFADNSDRALDDLFKTPIPPKPGRKPSLPTDEAFNEVSQETSSSNLFEDAMEDDESTSILGSGINLADPNAAPDPLLGPSSSIFTSDINMKKSHVELDEIPIMASSDEASDAMRFTLEQDENNSSIFSSGKKKTESDPESVFEDMPVPDPLSKAEAEAGAIDWQLPSVSAEQLSQRMQVDEDVFEENADADEDLFASSHYKADDDVTDWDALSGDISAESRATPDALRGDGELSDGLAMTPPPPRKLNETAGIPFKAAKEGTATQPKATPKKPASKKLSSAEFEVPEPRPGKSGGGLVSWLGGSALGVMLGVGASAGAYFGGLLPGDSKPTASQPLANANVPPPSPSSGIEQPKLDAKALLAAGDPKKALEVLEAAGEQAPVSVKADRGQARWLNRLRELAANPAGLVSTDEQFKKAEQDLEAVVNGADQLKTDEEKQAGVRAALHLGLLKEVTGDVAGATKIYTEARAKFPGSAQVFKTALDRLKLTRPTTNQQSKLKPQEALHLAQAAVLTLTLVQDPPKTEKPADHEPGFLFWEASNLAASGNYDEALKQLAAAKKLHEQRRLALAGKGTNPLSDPLEQIFSRSCDDLADYWKLKKELYTHPKFGEAIAKQGVTPALNQIDQQNQALAMQKTTADKELAASKQLLEMANAAKMKALEDFEKINKELTNATVQLTKASLQIHRSDLTLNAIVKELKANKLVDDKDDTATVLAKLPSVLKEASAAASSADVKKAAAALLEAKKERDAALAQATTALEMAKKAQADAKKTADELATVKLMTEMQIQMVKDGVKDEVKLAVTKAQADNLKEIEKLNLGLKQAQADLLKQQTDFQVRLDRTTTEHTKQLAAKDAELLQKLQQKEAQHQQAMADARAGATVPLSSAEVVARDRASQSFGRGVDFYFAGQYVAAEASFALSTSLDANDARYWYFLGLARTMMGRSDAEAAFKRGAEQERRGLPATQVIDDSLERVQGSTRQTLTNHRPR